MPDLSGILRKAREHAVLHGAAGASGATAEKLSVFNARHGQDGGPTVETGVGPVGPPADLGPSGPKAFQVVGPTWTREETSSEQRLSGAGPSGPTGPSEKQHVREKAAPIVARALLPDTPQGWRDGLARLNRWAPPCPGFRSGEWDRLHGVIADFMDRRAAEAFASGWRTIDLFGVHRDAGAAAVDSCGALMLPCMRAVTAVSDEALTFGPLVYRRRPIPQAVPAWEFAGGGWREEAE